MKMVIPCSECGKNGIFNIDFIEVEITNEGVYEANCKNGHTSLTFVQAPLFEVLFDMGGLALIDGYNREAVANFAVSLERFYEFCIEVMSYDLEIDNEEYEQTWKMMNRSERQIGAFYILYLNVFKKKPISIEKLNIGDKNIVNFRNNVVHNGYIPSRKSAIEFGAEIYKYILLIYNELQEKCEAGIFNAQTKKQRKYYETNGHKKTENITFMSSPTMLSISRGNTSEENSFCKSLESLKEHIYFRYSK